MVGPRSLFAVIVANAADSHAPASLVGTWRLVSFEDVESDISNGYAGTDQRRPFHLDGDHWVIGDCKTWSQVLERVR